MRVRLFLHFFGLWCHRKLSKSGEGELNDEKSLRQGYKISNSQASVSCTKSLTFYLYYTEKVEERVDFITVRRKWLKRWDEILSELRKIATKRPGMLDKRIRLLGGGRKPDIQLENELFEWIAGLVANRESFSLKRIQDKVLELRGIRWTAKGSFWSFDVGSSYHLVIGCGPY